MKRKPCSEATKAKISAAMRGNKNGRPHKTSMSARVLASRRAMDENRAERIHRFLAANPAADAARKAKIAAAIRAHWQRRREEQAKEQAERASLAKMLRAVSRDQLRAWTNAAHPLTDHEQRGGSMTMSSTKALKDGLGAVGAQPRVATQNSLPDKEQG